jgi:hypothetical protein
MNPRIQMVAILGSIAVAGAVFELIRRRKLREEYALLWLVASALLVGLSLWRESIHIAARLAGVAYPPSVLLLGVIVAGFLLSMQFSIALTRLADQNKRLTQELALLRDELSVMKSANDTSGQLSPA